MDSQPFDLCPELAVLPGKRGSRIFAHLYSPPWDLGFSNSSCFISSEAFKQTVLKVYIIWILGDIFDGRVGLSQTTPSVPEI